MRPLATRFVTVAVVLFFVIVTGAAQERRPASPAGDPRVGLKAGLRDAGEAARNMELLAHVPKPEGFFDPKTPAGPPVPPELRTDPPEVDPRAALEARRGQITLSFATSDLAFRESHVIVGNYHGFNVYDIENPRAPRRIASVVCPGGQGDVSIHGNLLFMSVEQTRGRLDCGVQGVTQPASSSPCRTAPVPDP